MTTGTALVASVVVARNVLKLAEEREATNSITNNAFESADNLKAFFHDSCTTSTIAGVDICTSASGLEEAEAACAPILQPATPSGNPASPEHTFFAR